MLPSPHGVHNIKTWYTVRFRQVRLYIWVSQQILGTSAQLGYTVPITLVQARKYRTEDKLKTDTLQKLNTTQKNKQRKTQQNKTSLVQSPHTTLGQETRWAYSTKLPSPHGATVHLVISVGRSTDLIDAVVASETGFLTHLTPALPHLITLLLQQLQVALTRWAARLHRKHSLCLLQLKAHHSIHTTWYPSSHNPTIRSLCVCM